MFGLLLAEQENVDKDILSLFALFHDSCRENDFADLNHGPRASKLLTELFHHKKLPISIHHFNKLHFACKHHTDTTFSENLTIGCCWDADRLDLTRIGVFPDHNMLNTSSAKLLVKSPDFVTI